jgi:hypothetical protein
MSFTLDSFRPFHTRRMKEFDSGADKAGKPSETAAPRSASQLDDDTAKAYRADDPAFKVNPFVSSTGASPFASRPTAASPSSPASSSSSSSSSSDPFGIPLPSSSSGALKEGSEFEREPWWAFIKQITPAQIFIVFSFTTIIALMIGTFYVVLMAGGIRMNDDI